MKRSFLLIFIVFLAFFLRFWQLGINPPSLTWDETAWGYNAYSLGLDGRDEFGRVFPLDYLESFGDFKPPVYAYLDILPVKLFGLNEFSTRFPSAFLGSLTVVLTYFLTKRIFSKKESPDIYVEWLALVAAFFLAISPWHINLSRAAFEANVATFFLVLGIYGFISWVHLQKGYLILSAVSFVLSIYTFNTSRVFAPLMILALAVGYRKMLMQNKKQTLVACLVGLVLLAPTARFLISPQASLRFKEVNIFSDISVIERTNQEIKNDDSAMWSKIIHNRRLTYGVEYLRHYFDNLNPAFLFIKGDGNPKFSTQDVGQMYVWDILFLVVGVLMLFKFKQGEWWIVPVWIILSIIPAATARETPHALRIETMLPTVQIVTAYGFVFVFQQLWLLKRQFLYPGLSIALFLLTLNFVYYYHGYYAHYPSEFSGEWQYGYKEFIQYAVSLEKDYKSVYFTTVLGRPYVYYLFYTKTDPAYFRKNSIVHRDAFGFVNVKKVGKFSFVDDVKNIAPKEQSLFVDVPQNIPENAKILKRFNLLNGDVALVAYTK